MSRFVSLEFRRIVGRTLMPGYRILFNTTGDGVGSAP